MEKWMIVYLLPLEVWMDIFCFPWISRSEFGQLVARIGNFKFAEHAQFYLHEWGKRTLGDLYFKQQGIMNCPNGFQPLEYPQTAMPENIKFFNTFQIQAFDNQIFNFFRRIQSLLTADTNLEIRFKPERDIAPNAYSNIGQKEVAEQLGNACTILRHLLPLIDGVYTLQTDDRILSILQSFTPEKFDQIKVLDVRFTRFVQSAMQSIMEWLTTASNEPKLLHVWCYRVHIAQRVLETIRKQFMEAKESSTFVVVSNNHDFPAFHCENAIGEQMDGITNNGKFTVFRHQANAEARDQLRAWVDGNVDKDKNGVYGRKQCIQIIRTTIGDEPIFAMPDLDEAVNEEKEEDEDDKPSTSKKRRICE